MNATEGRSRRIGRCWTSCSRKGCQTRTRSCGTQPPRPSRNSSMPGMSRCFTLHPAPCTLHLAPCTLHPESCTLHPAPCVCVARRPAPQSLIPTRCWGMRWRTLPTPTARFRTLYSQPCTLHPAPYTLHHAPCTLRPQPSTLNHGPWTLNPQPYQVLGCAMAQLAHLASPARAKPQNLNPNSESLLGVISFRKSTPLLKVLWES